MRKQISQLLDKNIELKEICKIVDCSPSTVHRVKKLKSKVILLKKSLKKTKVIKNKTAPLLKIMVLSTKAAQML